MQCQYFLFCKNEATTTIPNPIVGDVAVCQRCIDKIKRIENLGNCTSPRVENVSEVVE